MIDDSGRSPQMVSPHGVNVLRYCIIMLKLAWVENAPPSSGSRLLQLLAAVLGTVEVRKYGAGGPLQLRPAGG